MWTGARGSGGRPQAGSFGLWGSVVVCDWPPKPKPNPKPQISSQTPKPSTRPLSPEAETLNVLCPSQDLKQKLLTHRSSCVTLTVAVTVLVVVVVVYEVVVVVVVVVVVAVVEVVMVVVVVVVVVSQQQQQQQQQEYVLPCPSTKSEQKSFPGCVS